MTRPGALGTTGSGGKLPGYIASDDTQYVPEFVTGDPRRQPHRRGSARAVQVDFGWHVVQVMYHPPDQAQMEKLKTEADGGGDFAQLARDFSESATSGAGGDLGWIARGQLDQQQVDAIFAAPIGKNERDRQRDRRRAVPLQGVRGAGADPRGTPARRPPPERVQRLVCRQEGDRSSSIGAARGASRAVLDALGRRGAVALEARPRRRASRSLPAERLARDAHRGHPGHCSIVPLATLPSRRTTEALSSPLPGRARTAPDVTRSPCCGRPLSRPTTRSMACSARSRQ